MKSDKKNLSFWSKKCLSPQNEPQTAKLSLSAVLKHFYRKRQKILSFISKKLFLIEKSSIQLHQVFCCFEAFLSKLTKKLLFLAKQVFFFPN